MAELIAMEDGVVATSKCENSSGSRKEKRKVAKKEKRKQLRKELAEKARQAEEARLNDPEEQRRIQLEEEKERERVEREKKEFEERERLFLEALARKRAEEEEEERRRAAEEQELKKNQAEQEDEQNEDDDWEYIEEGPPEIIWQGNEIIVKKNRVKVKKKDSDLHNRKEGADRPTSNPLPPQSEAFADHQNAPALSAQQLLENVAQQVPNFGTEQDKAHCPFHLKTGACRFGSRCSRVHFYPNKSCTLLMKNMYIGPGLAWEQDEGLESALHKSLQWGLKSFGLHGSVINYTTDIYTDEEVERSYEEFYEDVHTEFLKYGEIVNFKVCRNGAFHLRGNLYVHYLSLDSAVMAYHSMNGRYFAGKQVNCEFVGVTRWKIAICGEYMKSRLKTCSRGSACNFVHCFRNPGGDYEWADWDKPPPRFWVKKMNALFGNSKDLKHDKEMEEESPGKLRNSSRQIPADRHRYHSRRSRSREKDSFNERSSRSHSEDRDFRKSMDRHSNSRKRKKTYEETNSRRHQHKTIKTSDTGSAGVYLDIESNAETSNEITRKSSRGHRSKVPDLREYRGGNTNKTNETESDGDLSDCDTVRDRQHDFKRKRSTHKKQLAGLHDYHCYDSTGDKDENWSDLEMDKRKHHARRTHNRTGNHHAKSTDYKEYKDESSSRAHETCDGDLSDTDRKRERRQGHKRKSSSDHDKVSLDFEDNRSGGHASDIDREWSHEGKDSRSQRKDSKRRKGVSDIHERTRYKKCGTHSTDTHSIVLEEERYRPEEDRYRPEV